jgi:hypothetical protein
MDISVKTRRRAVRGSRVTSRVIHPSLRAALTVAVLASIVGSSSSQDTVADMTKTAAILLSQRFLSVQSAVLPTQQLQVLGPPLSHSPVDIHQAP